MAISSSRSFFESSLEEEAIAGLPDFHSLKARASCLKIFLHKLLLLPLILLHKLYKTCFRLIGMAFSVALLVLTLGGSESVREFLFNRVAALATDLADWIFFPFAFLWFCLKVLLSLSVHPALFNSM